MLERLKHVRIAAGAIVLLAAIVLAGIWLLRGPADSDYFGPNEPTWVRVPTTLGDSVYVGIAVLHARPGDTLVLESVEVGGLVGGAVVAPIARLLPAPQQIIGAIRGSELGGEIDASSYGSPAGLSFSAANGTVELAAKVSGTTPVHGFDGIHVRFRVEGERAVIEDWIPVRASICTGETLAAAIEVCRPIEAEMHSSGP